MSTYKSEFPLFSKIGRQLWLTIQGTLFHFGLRNSHAWRIFWLRMFGSTIHPGCKVYRGIRIWAPRNLSIHQNAILGDRVDCYNVAPITIGPSAIISQDAFLCAATHDYENPDFILQPRAITIEEGAWVCARAFIGPGVTVGRYAVVGACAVVSKDVPAYAVIAGNPAKFIKWRDMSMFPEWKGSGRDNAERTAGSGRTL